MPLSIVTVSCLLTQLLHHLVALVQDEVLHGLQVEGALLGQLHAQEQAPNRHFITSAILLG